MKPRFGAGFVHLPPPLPPPALPTSRCLLSVSLAPPLPDTVNLMVNVPLSLNLWVAVFPDADEPSPKFQLNLVIEPVLAEALNLKLVLTSPPVFGLIENAAFTAAAAAAGLTCACSDAGAVADCESFIPVPMSL